MKSKNCSFCGKKPVVAEVYGFMPVCLDCKNRVEEKERQRKEETQRMKEKSNEK